MSKAAGRAMLLGCAGSLAGLFVGAAVGLIICMNAVRTDPPIQPSNDGQRELVRKLEVGSNKARKFVGGAVGTLVGAILGAVVGAGLSAGAAALLIPTIEKPTQE